MINFCYLAEESHVDTRRKEPIRNVEPHVEPKIPPVHEPEPKKEIVLGKRTADVPLEPVVETKKPCVKEIPLEDDLSEISDDADEILNRDEVTRICTFLNYSKYIVLLY